MGLVGLALVARDTEDLDLARQRLMQALEIDPEDSLAKRSLGALPSEDTSE